MSFSIQNAECGDGNAGTSVYAHWRLRCAAAKGAAQLPPGKCYSALTAAGCTGSTLCGFRLRRLPALTRRCDIPAYGIVNCTPAKGCVWPVAAPAEARVRAGAVLCGVGGKSPSIAHRIAHRLKQIRTIERLSRCAVRFYWNVLRSFTPAIRSCWNVLRSFTPVIRSCWNVLRSDHACLFSFIRKRETACGILRFYSARVGIAISTFSNVVRLSNFVGSLRACTFLYGDPDGVRRDAETRGTESAARRRYAFAQAY